jgi:hypothetical protein
MAAAREVPMSDEPNARVQTKATTKEGIVIERLAVATLRAIIGQSISLRREYGGVIYRMPGSGRIGITGPFKGDREDHVDVGQEKPNFGCPDGSKPVAWYHTHPIKEKFSVTPQGVVRMAMEWDKFIEGDQVISDGNNLTGYMIDPDRQLWRYDPPPGFMLNGKWTTNAMDRGFWGKLLING